MIDWINITANTLWLLGLALGLAALSHAAWAARLQGGPLRQHLRQPGYQGLFSLAGVLFCLGLTATAAAAWERAVWALLGLAFAAQLALARRAAPEQPAESGH